MSEPPPTVKEVRTNQLDMLVSLLERGLHRMAWTSVQPFPYGMWRLDDGQEVIFARGYEPLWRHHVNGVIEMMSGNEWITGFDRHNTVYFFHDRTDPYLQFEQMKRLRAVLRKWGLRSTVQWAEIKHEYRHRQYE